jgi:hypothetical protein
MHMATGLSLPNENRERCSDQRSIDTEKPFLRKGLQPRIEVVSTARESFKPGVRCTRLAQVATSGGGAGP